MVHKPTNNRNGIGCRRLPCSGLRLAVLYRTDHSHGRKVLDSAQIVQLHPATTADYSKLVNQLLCHSYHTQTEDQTKDQTKEQPLAVIATHPTPFLLSLSLHNITLSYNPSPSQPSSSSPSSSSSSSYSFPSFRLGTEEKSTTQSSSQSLFPFTYP